MTSTTNIGSGTKRPALRKVLVTGGTGFVGSHLCKRLAQAGVKVVEASRATGFDLLSGTLPLDGIDHIFHAAANTFVPNAWDDPVAFHVANGHGTFRVLDQARRAGSIPLTYVSGYVYGVPDELPISESAPTRANNPYGFSKLAGEQACRFFVDAYNARVSILRVFNVYGRDQGGTFLIPTIARQVLDPAVPEIVVDSLSPRRDYVHIDDVVNALLISPDLPSGQPFNVGSGRSESVESVIRACLAAAQIDKPYRGRGVTRSNEVHDVVADISALVRSSNWCPSVDFASGIASVIESLRP